MAALTAVEILLSIFLPPLGVFLRVQCGLSFWLCLLLTFFGWLPGVIYAVWVLVQ